MHWHAPSPPLLGVVAAGWTEICLCAVNNQQTLRVAQLVPCLLHAFFNKYNPPSLRSYSLTWRVVGGRGQRSHLVRRTATLDHDRSGQRDGSASIDLRIGGCNLSAMARERRSFSFCIKVKCLKSAIKYNNVLYKVSIFFYGAISFNISSYFTSCRPHTGNIYSLSAA